MDLDELLAEKEWRLCRGFDDSVEGLLAGFQYFCENHWWIKHPERGRILFDLWDAQVETAQTWLSERYSLVLKSRQIGFSTLVAAYSFWLAFFWPDRFIVMLSRTEREAAKLLAKSKYGWKNLADALKKRGPELVAENQLKLAFGNESSLESLPSGNDPARGESVFLVVVDEWAFLPNAEEAWASIEPIADVGGRIIGLSTANGAGNFFHQLWVGSQTGTNKFKGIFFPWSAGHNRGEDWYAAKKASMPAWQLHQEYPSNPEEAFIRSGNPVITLGEWSRGPLPEPRRGMLWIGERRSAEFRELGDDGEFAVWEEPHPSGVYVVGADVAEGLAHGDYSCAQVINARTNKVDACWHGHIEPDLFGVLLAELGWWLNGALIGVENNNHGLTTLKALQKHGYKNIFRQRRLGQRTAPQTEILGWRTTMPSKRLAIDELGAMLRSEDPALTLQDAHTVAELRTFVRDQQGRMHGSPHDDRVMALAIAVQMLKYVWLPEYRNEAKPPKFSGAWFDRMADDRDDASKRTPIGAHNVRFAAR